MLAVWISHVGCRNRNIVVLRSIADTRHISFKGTRRPGRATKSKIRNADGNIMATSTQLYVEESRREK